MSLSDPAGIAVLKPTTNLPSLDLQHTPPPGGDAQKESFTADTSLKKALNDKERVHPTAQFVLDSNERKGEEEKIVENTNLLEDVTSGTESTDRATGLPDDKPSVPVGVMLEDEGAGVEEDSIKSEAGKLSALVEGFQVVGKTTEEAEPVAITLDETQAEVAVGNDENLTTSVETQACVEASNDGTVTEAELISANVVVADTVVGAAAAAAPKAPDSAVVDPRADTDPNTTITEFATVATLGPEPEQVKPEVAAEGVVVLPSDNGPSREAKEEEDAPSIPVAEQSAEVFQEAWNTHSKIYQVSTPEPNHVQTEDIVISDVEEPIFEVEVDRSKFDEGTVEPTSASEGVSEVEVPRGSQDKVENTPAPAEATSDPISVSTAEVVEEPTVVEIPTEQVAVPVENTVEEPASIAEISAEHISELPEPVATPVEISAEESISVAEAFAEPEPTIQVIVPVETSVEEPAPIVEVSVDPIPEPADGAGVVTKSTKGPVIAVAEPEMVEPVGKQPSSPFTSEGGATELEEPVASFGVVAEEVSDPEPILEAEVNEETSKEAETTITSEASMAEAVVNTPAEQSFEDNGETLSEAISPPPEEVTAGLAVEEEKIVAETPVAQADEPAAETSVKAQEQLPTALPASEPPTAELMNEVEGDAVVDLTPGSEGEFALISEDSGELPNETELTSTAAEAANAEPIIINQVDEQVGAPVVDSISPASETNDELALESAEVVVAEAAVENVEVEDDVLVTGPALAVVQEDIEPSSAADTVPSTEPVSGTIPASIAIDLNPPAPIDLPAEESVAVANFDGPETNFDYGPIGSEEALVTTPIIYEADQGDAPFETTVERSISEPATTDADPADVNAANEGSSIEYDTPAPEILNEPTIDNEAHEEEIDIPAHNPSEDSALGADIVAEETSPKVKLADSVTDTSVENPQELVQDAAEPVVETVYEPQLDRVLPSAEAPAEPFPIAQGTPVPKDVMPVDLVDPVQLDAIEEVMVAVLGQGPADEDSETETIEIVTEINEPQQDAEGDLMTEQNPTGVESIVSHLQEESSAPKISRAATPPAITTDTNLKSPLTPSFHVVTVGRSISPGPSTDKDGAAEATAEQQVGQGALVEPEVRDIQVGGENPAISLIVSDTSTTHVNGAHEAAAADSEPASLEPSFDITRPWSPSYAVHSQGTPLHSTSELPLEESGVPIDEPIAEAAPVETIIPSPEAVTEAFSLWTPSYSVISQGTPLQAATDLEPETSGTPTIISVPSENTVPSQYFEDIVELMDEVVSSIKSDDVPPTAEAAKVETGAGTASPVTDVPVRGPTTASESVVVSSEAPPLLVIWTNQPTLIVEDEVGVKTPLLDRDELPATPEANVEEPIEKPKSPSTWTPSYSVSSQGSPAGSPRDLPVDAKAEVEVNTPVEPSVAKVVLAEAERPRSPSGIASYFVSNQGSPLVTLVQMDSTEPGEIIFVPKIPVAFQADVAIEADVEPAGPSVDVAGSPDAPQAETIEISPPVEVAPVPEVESEQPKLPWVTSYSVSNQGSPAIPQADIKFNEPGVPAIEDAEPEPEVAAQPAVNIPAIVQPEVETEGASEIERPKSPWVSSYSVSTQGSPTVAPIELASVGTGELTETAQTLLSDAAPAELTEPVLAIPDIKGPEEERIAVVFEDVGSNLSSLDQVLSAEGEPERPKSPWVTSYSLTTQGSPLVSITDVHDTAAEPTEILPAAEAFEQANDIEPVTEKPTIGPLDEKTELIKPATTTPATNTESEVSDEFKAAASNIIVAPSPITVLLNSKHTSETSTGSRTVTPVSGSADGPKSPWSPSYSVTHQGSLTSDGNNDKFEALPRSAVVAAVPSAVEVSPPIDDSDLLDDDFGDSPTPKPEKQQQRSQLAIDTNTDNVTRFIGTFLEPSPAFVNSPLPPLDEYGVDDEPPHLNTTGPVPRSRLESSASSKLFPGAWFSPVKSLDHGRASMDVAQGEFTPSKQASPVGDSVMSEPIPTIAVIAAGEPSETKASARKAAKSPVSSPTSPKSRGTTRNCIIM